MRIINSSFVYFCIGLALIGYILPWIVTPTAPLTLGAYDLAEWTSLHPSQPTTIPALIVPLLLRVQLVIITLIIALAAQTDKLRFIAVAAIIPLSIAQLPPLEFLTIATNNINYQQQFILATISLVIGLTVTKFKPLLYIPFIGLLLVVAGLVSAIVGVQQAQSLYKVTKFKPLLYVPFIGLLLVGTGLVSAIVGVQQAQALYRMSLQENSLGAGVIFTCVAYSAIGLTYLLSLNIKLSTTTTQQLSEIKQGNL